MRKEFTRFSWIGVGGSNSDLGLCRGLCLIERCNDKTFESWLVSIHKSSNVERERRLILIVIGERFWCWR